MLFFDCCLVLLVENSIMFKSRQNVEQCEETSVLLLPNSLSHVDLYDTQIYLTKTTSNWHASSKFVKKEAQLSTS